MRRIWVAIGLFILSAILAFTEFYLAMNSCEKFVTKLETAETYISNKEFSEATLVCDNTRKKWENRSKILNVFLVHSKSDSIYENFNKLCELAKNKESKEFLYLCEKTKRQLLCLKQSELPNLENIM